MLELILQNTLLRRLAMRPQRARRNEMTQMKAEIRVLIAANLDMTGHWFSGCTFSRDGEMLATCYLSQSIYEPIYFCLFSLSGVAKIWRVPQVTKVSTVNHLATESTDHTAMLWNTDGSLLKKFEGHLDRLARIGFHPSGKYLGTTRFDKTWRLKYRFWCGADWTRLHVFGTPTYWEKYNGIEKPCQTGSWNQLFIQWLSCRYFKPVKTLSAHEAKVTSLNIPNLDKQGNFPNFPNFPNLDKQYNPKYSLKSSNW
uniref:Uncharacterized protein n=1 Tax=Salix viminalis TaxID=40686 RepID=A0A6N2N5D2_SALVM